MIKISRGLEPVDFASQSTQWWNEFQREKELAKLKKKEISASDFWSRVRKRKVMKKYASQLYQSFHHKCVFCESRMSHVSPAHIEHFRPKSNITFEELMFKWENWLLSCHICNTNKGTYFENCGVEPCLIDPTVDAPSIHLDFLESQILFKTERGEKTIKQIQLDRTLLMQERTQWLANIKYLLILILKVPEASHEARNLVIWAMQDNAPYAAMTRTYLSKKTPKLAHPDVPHPIIKLNDPLNRINELLETYYNEDLEKLI